jgi:hypothetical protein
VRRTNADHAPDLRGTPKSWAASTSEPSKLGSSGYGHRHHTSRVLHDNNQRFSESHAIREV